MSKANHVHTASQGCAALATTCTHADVVMKKAFDEGWGGVICKTLSLDSKKVCVHSNVCTCAHMPTCAPIMCHRCDCLCRW